MIIGVSGLNIDRSGARRVAGAGKDTVAQRLVSRHGFAPIAMADPLKRFLQDVLGFTDDQLWGDSEKRIQVDVRYGASPREALTGLGDWGRSFWAPILAEYARRSIGKVESGGWYYDQKMGLRPWITVIANDFSEPGAMPKKNFVITDLRYEMELAAVKALRDSKVVRVVHQHAGLFGDQPMDSHHSSEVELPLVPDSEFDAVIQNDGTKDELFDAVDAVMANFKEG